jgi:hypothetical protein
LTKGLELIVAPTTEALTFAVATQDIVLTTTPTATVKPGDVIVVYDSVYNNKAVHNIKDFHSHYLPNPFTACIR